jgi:hypothetical protein
MQGEKLFIRAEVANQGLSNAIWNEIKKAARSTVILRPTSLSMHPSPNRRLPSANIW